MTIHWAAAEPPTAGWGSRPAVRTSWDGGILVVHVAGDLDADVGRQVAVAVAATPGWSRAVLDLEAVSWLDGDGVRAVLDVLARAQERGGELAIAAFDPGTVQQLFGHGIGLIAAIVANVTDAIRILQRPPVPGAPSAVWATSRTSA